MGHHSNQVDSFSCLEGSRMQVMEFGSILLLWLLETHGSPPRPKPWASRSFAPNMMDLFMFSAVRTSYAFCDSVLDPGSPQT